MPLTIINLMKSFSLFHLEVQTETLIFWMSIIYSIVNGVFRNIFGLLFDKFGINVIRVTTGIEVVISVSIYFTSEIVPLYFILTIIVALVHSANNSNLPALLAKIYGINNYSQISGLTAIFNGLAGLAAPILSKTLRLSKSNDDTPFLILFEIGAALSLVSLVMILLINDSPFDYEQLKQIKLNKLIDMIQNKESCQNTNEQLIIIGMTERVN